MPLEINFQSTKVFFTKICFNETLLSTGSSFIAGNGKNYLLFTNRHNVTGRNNETDELLSRTGGIPNNLKIAFPDIKPKAGEIGGIKSWIEYTIPLYSDLEGFQDELWFEYPDNNKIDAIGIKFNDDNLDLPNLSYSITESWYSTKIDERVNIIGFPFGISADNFPIWSSGYVASEPKIDFNNLPLFLVDCRTRKGQSGSPVTKTFLEGATREIKNQTYKLTKDEVHLLGIYSGRINSESDLSRVWKIEALQKIFNYAYK